MSRHALVSAIFLLTTQLTTRTALAGDHGDDDSRDDKDKAVVLLNATAKLGDLGPVDKIRHGLAGRALDRAHHDDPALTARRRSTAPAPR